MKPRRAIGLLAVTVLLACVAAWLTPQQQFPVVPATALDGAGVPLLFDAQR